MPAIENLFAREILDSRGRPTLWARCTLAGGATAAVSVPSGASTGAAEAHELRDGDPTRYGGLGCRRAAANVSDVIFPAVRDRVFATQAAFDGPLLELDGTPNKANLGANALLAVSLAFARAVAVDRRQPLYARFAEMLSDAGQDAPAPSPRLPRPTVNLFSGGKHAGGQVAIQDVLVVPVAANTADEAISTVAAVYAAAVAHCRERYGTRPLVADEGGLAPDFPNAEAMLDDAVAAIERAGFAPGREVALCVDVAASHFFTDGRYHLGGDPLGLLDSAGMVAHLAGPGGWLDRYPIVSIEDGLAEDDWGHWPALKAALQGRALTLGDDFLCTRPARIERAIAAGAADALLLKVNQIGTLSEAATAYKLARSAGWKVVVSARSGETEDDWLTDLAVGWGGDALKVGSITRSERLAKWNRLLLIEAETGWPLTGWPNLPVPASR
jgi:enolase